MREHVEDDHRRCEDRSKYGDAFECLPAQVSPVANRSTRCVRVPAGTGVASGQCQSDSTRDSC